MALMRRVPLMNGFLKNNAGQLTGTRGIKVCVLGAMGGVGQNLSFLLKQSRTFEDLALFDLKCSRGLALELSQIDTSCRVTGYNDIKSALKGAHIVINVAGFTHRVGMSLDDFFSLNAKALVETTKDCAQHCPKAFHVIITNPLNSTVPMACEVYKKVLGCVEPGRVFGLTGVDQLRAASILAEMTHTPPEQVTVPVVGGHSSTTVVPLFSRAEPCVNLSTDETVRMTRAVQTAPQDVRTAKEFTAPPVVATATAALRLAEDLVMGMVGKRGIVTCSYVMSNVVPSLKYFASQIELGPSGVQKIFPLPNPLSNYECCLLQSAVEIIKKDIQKGIKYAQS